MIRIPLTKVKVSWHLPALLLIFMAVAPTWQRGLLGFVVMLGSIWLLGMALWLLFTLLVDSKKRRPDESLREFSARKYRELARFTATREAERQHSPGYTSIDKYRYVTLDCGHVVFDDFPDGLPQEGDMFWCWGHRRFGPAQEQMVISVNRWQPENVQEADLL